MLPSGKTKFLSFYKDKTLAVVGGSDSAAQASLFLTGYGNKVFIIIRRDHLTAEPITADQVMKHDKIELVPKSNIQKILGKDDHVNQLKLDTGKTLDVDGLFVEVGHIPRSELAKSIGVEVDEKGFVKVDREQKTNVAGIFAAGDITNATTLKQFITSGSEGLIAAQTAYHTLSKQE